MTVYKGKLNFLGKGARIKAQKAMKEQEQRGERPAKEAEKKEG